MAPAATVNLAIPWDGGSASAAVNDAGLVGWFWSINAIEEYVSTEIELAGEVEG